MAQDPLARTPLHELHLALGAKMVPFAGYEMPVQYPSGVMAEHLHARAEAGLFDVSHMGQARLAGATAAKDLETLVTGDIAALASGRMRYTLFTNDAAILPEMCEVIIDAYKLGSIKSEKAKDKAEILIRGFARVGIVALVDEATGYEKDRVAGSLAKILEAFIAKELQPYVKTFPADYYEQLFRIYNLPYPPIGNKSWRPSFIGKITNDVIYARFC